MTHLRQLRIPRRVLASLAAVLLLVGLGRAQGAGVPPAAPFENLRAMTPTLFRCFPSFAAGDVDGDGSIDLVVLDQGLVLTNDGLGRYDVALSGGQAGLAGALMLYGSLADLDGDGDADLLAGFCALDLFLNDGTGFFERDSSRLPAASRVTCPPNTCTIRPCVSSPNLIGTADFDGDGSTDIYWQGALFLNDGAGNFVDASAQLAPASSAPAAPLTRDFDGDGDADVIAFGLTSSAQLGCLLMRNDGSACFSVEPLGIPDAPLVAADLDSDGDADLIAGTDLFLNDGGGGFLRAGAVLPAGFDQAGAGDVDADGDVDILAASTSSLGVSGVKLLLNQGAGTFVEAPGAALPSDLSCSFQGELVDVDRDGDPDLAFGNALWLNDGKGRFSDVTDGVPERHALHSALALGDIDGDGWADALTALETATGSFELELLRNDRLGGFAPVPGAVPALDAAWIRLLDGDLDGDLDAVAGTPIRPTYLENDGGAFVVRPASLPASNFEARNAVAVDVDLDGDLDLVYSAKGRAPQLHLSDGHGVFVDASARIAGSFVDARWIDAGDVDGDGAPDLLVARFEAQNALLGNDGQGTFAPRTGSLPSDADPSVSALLADLDGDDDLDALFGNGLDANFLGPAPRFYRNDGRGSFADSSSDWHAISFGSAMLAVDVDGDGDHDVVGSNNEFFENDGTGVLDPATMPTKLVSRPTSIRGSLEFSMELALADLDLDGDEDLFLSGFPALHFNTTRALAWRSTPRVGKPLTLDLHGPAGAPWLLLVSREPGHIESDLGLLRLDPRALHFAGHGRLDDHGRAARTFNVPADPALVSRSFYWQALVGAPARLTNLERTRFTDL